MAITLTNINGTDAISATRISINDNFETIKDALNDVLTIVDIATGKINNYGFGSNNDMETEDLIVRGSTGGGISVLSGGINVSAGNIVVGGTSGSGLLQLGAGSNSIFFDRLMKYSYATPSSQIPFVNLSGLGSTSGTGTIGAVVFPRLTTAVIADIAAPPLGSVVFNESTMKLQVCIGNTGSTGTWADLN